MRIVIPLQAGIPLRQFFRGRCLALMDLGVASEVDVTVFGADQQDAEEFGSCGKNFSLFYPDKLISGVELTASVNCTIEVIVSSARVETLDGANLTVTTTRGDAPGNPFFVTGLTYEDTPAATIVDAAAVAVGPVAAAVLAANASRLEARFTNIGADAAAIGAAGLTWAKRAIVLQPGDTWVEQKGAALAWVGITDAAGAASITVQELLA